MRRDVKSWLGERNACMTQGNEAKSLSRGGRSSRERLQQTSNRPRRREIGRKACVAKGDEELDDGDGEKGFTEYFVNLVSQLKNCPFKW